MLGLQILKRRRQVPAGLIDAFRGLPVLNEDGTISAVNAAGEEIFTIPAPYCAFAPCTRVALSLAPHSP